MSALLAKFSQWRWRTEIWAPSSMLIGYTQLSEFIEASVQKRLTVRTSMLNLVLLDGFWKAPRVILGLNFGLRFYRKRNL